MPMRDTNERVESVPLGAPPRDTGYAAVSGGRERQTTGPVWSAAVVVVGVRLPLDISTMIHQYTPRPRAQRKRNAATLHPPLPRCGALALHPARFCRTQTLCE